MILFVVRAGASRKMVTAARIVRISCIIRVLKVESEGFLEKDVVDPVAAISVLEVEAVVHGIQLRVHVVVRREEAGEWNKFRCEGTKLDDLCIFR